MAIITISRGSHSHGKDVAEKTAQRLNYQCISREILLEASKKFNIPELKLTHALRDAPSMLDQFTYGREKYIAYIQDAIYSQLQKDNVVYHGFAGHFFVQNVPHALRVRIIADIEDRVAYVMERDGLNKKDAEHLIKHLDEQRRKWSRQLYGIDTWDSSLYDMVINLKKIPEDHAVDLICQTVELDTFATTEEAKKAINDLALAASVKATLVDINPDLEVYADDGIVNVKTHAPLNIEEDLAAKMKDAAQGLPGLKEIRVHVLPILFSRRKRRDSL